VLAQLLFLIAEGFKNEVYLVLIDRVIFLN